MKEQMKERKMLPSSMAKNVQNKQKNPTTLVNSWYELGMEGRKT